MGQQIVKEVSIHVISPDSSDQTGFLPSWKKRRKSGGNWPIKTILTDAQRCAIIMKVS